MPATRLITLDDAARLAELVRANRAFHAPYEPDRAEEYYTVDGQRRAVADVLDRYDRGELLPHVILDECDRVVGRITLNHIIRGPLLSATLGYWLNEADTGRGLATAAVREIVALAFGPLGLHRVQAGTLTDNVASQRVLERTGFVRFGLAPSYLRIAGRWQDHVLFQLLAPELD